MESGVEFEAVDFSQANRLTIHIMAAVAEREANAVVVGATGERNQNVERSRRNAERTWHPDAKWQWPIAGHVGQSSAATGPA